MDSAPDVSPFWPLGGDIVLTAWLLASKISHIWSEDRELFKHYHLFFFNISHSTFIIFLVILLNFFLILNLHCILYPEVFFKYFCVPAIFSNDKVQTISRYSDEKLPLPSKKSYTNSKYLMHIRNIDNILSKIKMWICLYYIYSFTLFKHKYTCTFGIQEEKPCRRSSYLWRAFTCYWVWVTDIPRILLPFLSVSHHQLSIILKFKTIGK